MADRLKDFDSAELVYEESEALIEARRCLHCGRGAEVIDRKCVRCLTCVRCCPFLVPYMEAQAVFPRRNLHRLRFMRIPVPGVRHPYPPPGAHGNAAPGGGNSEKRPS